jgi:Na+-transporting methylmalonyl-CoA/oxaloacetate decarboxylase gamma subunit
MRAVFSVLSLLVVVAIIGVLARKQLGGGAPRVAPAAAATGAPADVPAPPTGTPQQQVQQVQKAIEQSLQQARPMPEDK